MDRRTLLTRALLASSIMVAQSMLPGQYEAVAAAESRGTDFPPLGIGPKEWKKILGEDRFRILFEEGTEPAGSSPLNKLDETGSYICAACYLPLFHSKDKFDSGTGWPSFTRPIDAEHIGTKRDWKLILPRTEYHCARCTGHQGHVFDDGPPPTGQRWCNNGLALRFVPEAETLPELRITA